jgi:hypothetical protein
MILFILYIIYLCNMYVTVHILLPVSVTRNNNIPPTGKLPHPLNPPGERSGRKAREQNRVSDLLICELRI